MGNVMPTAKQRMRLQELSTELFGVSSRWQKIMKSARVPVAELDKELTTDPNDPKFKLGYRPITIDELLVAFEDNVVAARLAKLPEEELLQTLAKQFVDKTMTVRLAVQIPEKDLAEAEDLFALLDAEVAERVKGVVVGDRAPHSGAFIVNGVRFLTELAYLKDPSLRQPALSGAAAGTDLHTSAEAAP